MAAKPKLTPEQWLECRHRWEADHRDGYQWLVDEMNLPVAHVSVRRVALRDGWKKAGSMKSIVQRAHIQADAKSAKRNDGHTKGNGMGNALPSNSSVTHAEAAVDIRSDVIDKHRAEWSEHREIFPLSSLVGNIEKGREGKIAAEMLKLRQDGDRKAWGLDAIVQEDHSAATDADLDAIYESVMRQSADMGVKAQRQYEELNGIGADGEAAD